MEPGTKAEKANDTGSQAKILDKLSIDFLKTQVYKNAYANIDTVIAKLDPRILLIWYLFFCDRTVVFRRPRIPFGELCFGRSDDRSCESGQSCTVFVYRRSLLTNGISLFRDFLFRRRRFRHHPFAHPDLKGHHGIARIHHRLFGSGPRPPFHRIAVVRLSRAVELFHFLFVSHAPPIIGRISAYSAELSAARVSAGYRHLERENLLPLVSGENDHERLLPAHAQYGKTRAYYRGSVGT